MSETLSTALLLAGALLCSAIGFGWIALAMEVHWEQVFGAASAPGAAAAAAPSPAPLLAPSPTRVRILRILGALALVGSLLLCLAADHPSMAALVWVMSLAAGALGITMLLSWQPRWLGLLVPRAGA